MAVIRKMLGKADSPYIVSLMRKIEMQSKATIAKWCLNYTEANILPIFEKRCPGDDRPRRAIGASRDWFEGKKKLPEVYDHIAAEECAKMEKALDDISVEDEPNPAKINWRC